MAAWVKDVGQDAGHEVEGVQGLCGEEEAGAILVEQAFAWSRGITLWRKSCSATAGDSPCCYSTS